MAADSADILSRDPAETQTVAERLGRAARAGDCIALVGDLGAGKTVFVKGLARGLGIDPNEVTSPTFVLMNRHEGRLPLHHFDAYRLGDAAELLAIGAEEAFYGEGVSVVEWADRVTDVLPEERLHIALTPEGGRQRRLRLRGHGSRGARLLAAARSCTPPGRT